MAELVTDRKQYITLMDGISENDAQSAAYAVGNYLKMTIQVILTGTAGVTLYACVHKTEATDSDGLDLIPVAADITESGFIFIEGPLAYLQARRGTGTGAVTVKASLAVEPLNY